MPYITVESGKLTNDQKESLIEKLTEVSSQVTGIPKEFFMITIKELSDTNIGIGGRSIDKTKKEYYKNHKEE